MRFVQVLVLSALMASSVEAGDDIASYPQYEWKPGHAVAADLNRNGQVDHAWLGIGADSVGLLVRIDSSTLPIIEIPIDGSRQFGICPGLPPEITLASQSDAPFNALGETPNGYENCPDCVEIVVGGGECDSLHFYWDAMANEIAWWRA